MNAIVPVTNHNPNQQNPKLTFSSWTSLPKEILEEILSILLNSDLGKYRGYISTCRSINSIAWSSSLLGKKFVLFSITTFCAARENSDNEAKKEYNHLLTKINRLWINKKGDNEKLVLLKKENYTDVNSAIRIAKGIFDQKIREEAVLQIAKNVAKTSPEEALNIISERSYSNQPRNNILQIIRVIAETDSEKAVRMVKEKYGRADDELFNQSLIEIIKVLAVKNLKQAEEIAFSIEVPEYVVELETSYQPLALLEVWKVKATSNPKETAEQLSEKTGLNFSGFLEIFKIILSSGLENAEKVLRNIDNNDDYRNSLLEEMIKILVEQDLEKAWTYVDMIKKDEPTKKKLLILVLDAMYTKEQRKFNKILSNSNISDEILIEIAIIQTRKDQSIENAKQTIERIGIALLKSQAIEDTLIELAVYSPDEAINQALFYDLSEWLIPNILYKIAENKPNDLLRIITSKQVTCNNRILSRIVEALLSKKKTEKRSIIATQIASMITDIELKNDAFNSIIEKSDSLRISIIVAKKILENGLSYAHVEALRILGNKALS